VGNDTLHGRLEGPHCLLYFTPLVYSILFEEVAQRSPKHTNCRHPPTRLQTHQRTVMSLVSNDDGHASCIPEIGVVTAATQHAVETMNDFRGSVPTQLISGLAEAFPSVSNGTRCTSEGDHYHTASAYIRFQDQHAYEMECVMTYANLEEPQQAVHAAEYSGRFWLTLVASSSCGDRRMGRGSKD
jgi:hypothetical protein